jgi:5-methylthioribose kinase
MTAAAADSGDLALLDDALKRMGLLTAGERVNYTPLTGGVASDIWRVNSAHRTFVIKRARARLKVADEWYVPVERNAYEVKWMEVARRLVPAAAPAVLGHDPAAGLFAMDWLDPVRFPNWKEELHCGRVDLGFAAEVGRRLVRIHAGTAGDPEIAAGFATDAVFHAIRLEAYLEATARRHPALSEHLMKLSRSTLATKRTLVHGDVSPKNILVGPEGPVFIDAECAWYGDPAFDFAFCLNHMLLKCLWTPSAAERFLAAYDALAQSYLAGVTWELPAEIERRTAALLSGLFLARVDGKSPVEYLTEAGRARVRKVGTALVAAPPLRLAELRQVWADEIGVRV